METADNLKQIVKEKYNEIARQGKEQNESSCCGSGGCSTEVYNIMSDDYTRLKGYNADADLGLGCGMPTEFAQIKKGDTVIDLGSGAGNDCFVARAITGEEGKIIGVDFSEPMIEKARANAEKLRYNNVEFRYGDIEKIPITANRAEVVVSNCVLNLAPDKNQVFKEIIRVLKPEGHFCVSDIVLEGELPSDLRKSIEMYAGCVAGAVQKEEYLAIISAAGFKNVKVLKEKDIQIPDDILSKYLPKAELEHFKKGTTGILSITVYGEKPKECCGPDCCK